METSGDVGSIIQVVKDVFNTFSSLGWLPIPFFAAIGIMLGLRLAFDQSSLTINTKEALRERMLWRVGIFVGTSLFTALLQFGLQKPANGFDRTLALGFTFADAIFAFVITNTDRVKKAFFKKGGTSDSNEAGV